MFRCKQDNIFQPFWPFSNPCANGIYMWHQLCMIDYWISLKKSLGIYSNWHVFKIFVLNCLSKKLVFPEIWYFKNTFSFNSDYLTDFSRNNWQSIIDIVKRLCYYIRSDTWFICILTYTFRPYCVLRRYSFIFIFCRSHGIDIGQPQRLHWVGQCSQPDVCGEACHLQASLYHLEAWHKGQ